MNLFLLYLIVSIVPLCLINCYHISREPRVVVSLTTSPKRIEHLEPTIQSLFDQEKPPDAIIVNLPHVFLRTNETFPPLSNYPYLQDPRITINRCNDLGPITKLYPTLELEDDPTTIIIILDDDTTYPSYMTKVMFEKSQLDPNFVQVGHCGDPLLRNEEDYFMSPPYDKYINTLSHQGGGCCCRLFEGFGSVGYRRSFFNNNDLRFQDYLKIVLENKYCFRSDDLVISNYVLGISKVQGLDLGIRVWQQAYGFDNDALHKLESGGHPYIQCSRFLQSQKLSFINVWNDELDKAPTPYPALPPQPIDNVNTVVNNDPVNENSSIQVPEEQLIQCGIDRTIYIMRNKQLHAIPNLQTFISMGRDFSEVRRISKEEFLQIPMGADIPSIV